MPAHSSIRGCARVFNVPYTTLQHRMSGRTSRALAHEYRQILSNAEEDALVRCITRLKRTGFPASPALILQIAEEIRRSRIHLSKITPPFQQPIGKSWLDRFRVRHPEIRSIWTRQIESARYKAVSYEVVETWFNAVTELFLANQYPPERIYNMDESGFGVVTSQSSRALVNIRGKSSWKVVNGRQEWITAIGCISASGVALPPLLIFKAKHTNSGWIPPIAPSNWRFSTSNSGWTSDSHAYEWLTTVFEPETKPEDPDLRRLLIMDGHGSHITANVIAYCMGNAIDLLILPPHTSHVPQPLDISVFAPLKRALALETDAASRLDFGRIQRVEWTKMYIRARERALIASNITSGWKAAGLWPLSLIVILGTLSQNSPLAPIQPQTPGNPSPLDLSILDSSPPDGTELRKANAALNSELERCHEVASPIKRYIARMTRAYEMTHSELTTIRKEHSAQKELLHIRKTRKKGKRISLKGRFVFSTQEVLEIAQQAEKETSAKKGNKTTRASSNIIQTEEQEEDILGNQSSDSEINCIVVAARRSS